jgi:hypothetical protein
MDKGRGWWPEFIRRSRQQMVSMMDSMILVALKPFEKVVRRISLGRVERC